VAAAIDGDQGRVARGQIDVIGANFLGAFHPQNRKPWQNRM